MGFFSKKSASDTIDKKITDFDDMLKYHPFFKHNLFNNIRPSAADEYADGWRDEYLAAPATIATGLCYSLVHSSLTVIKAICHLLEEEKSFLDFGIELLKAVGYFIAGVPIILLGILGTLASISRTAGAGILSLLNGAANASSASDDENAYTPPPYNTKNTESEGTELVEFNNIPITH